MSIMITSFSCDNDGTDHTNIPLCQDHMLLSLTVFYLFEHLHGYIAVAEQLVERATLHRLHNLTSTGPALNIARRTYDETVVTNFVCCPSLHCFIRRRHNAL